MELSKEQKKEVWNPIFHQILDLMVTAKGKEADHLRSLGLLIPFDQLNEGAKKSTEVLEAKLKYIKPTKASMVQIFGTDVINNHVISNIVEVYDLPLH